MGYGGSLRKYNRRSKGFWGIFNRTDISKKILHVFDYGIVRIKVKNGPGYLFLTKNVQPRYGYSYSQIDNKKPEPKKYCWIFSGQSEISKNEIIKYGQKVDEAELIEKIQKEAPEEITSLVLFNIDSVSAI